MEQQVIDNLKVSISKIAHILFLIEKYSECKNEGI